MVFLTIASECQPFWFGDLKFSSMAANPLFRLDRSESKRFPP